MTASYYTPKNKNKIQEKSQVNPLNKLTFFEDSLHKKTKVKQKDLLIFFKQLSVIIKSGVHLVNEGNNCNLANVWYVKLEIILKF